MQAVQPALPRAFRWSRTVYERLAESGTFDDQPVELIGGQVVEMSPKGPRHAAVTNRVRKVLERAFPAARFTVRPEQPLALGEWDEPEPDIAVADGDDLDYIDAHPTAAQTRLVVEVADTTASYDLGYKADMYAAARIADYWVVLPAERRSSSAGGPQPILRA